MRVVFLMCAGALVLRPAASAQDQEAGVVRGQQGIAVFNAVEGRTKVISAAPEGSRVKKGVMVCELDPVHLTDRLTYQEIIIKGAEAGLKAAALAREAAELAVTAYREVAFEGEAQTAASEIDLADSGRKRAEDRMVWSDRMYARGYVSKAENVADRISLAQKVLAYEQAMTRRKVLEEFTKEIRIKTLKSAVEEAKATEMARLAAFEREQAARKRLISQIRSCDVCAPANGRLCYPGSIEAGAIVAEGQLLFRVIPEDAPGARTQ